MYGKSQNSEIFIIMLQNCVATRYIMFYLKVVCSGKMTCAYIEA